MTTGASNMPQDDEQILALLKAKRKEVNTLVPGINRLAKKTSIPKDMKNNTEK